ncbi:adenylate/guanylate cyclase domain-containing protein [Streptosporangium sandarakinum]
MTGRPTAEQIESVFAGDRPRYTRIQVAELAGVPQSLTERIWRALGFATLPDDAVAFTDADVESLRRVRSMMDDGSMDDETTVRMARALGQTTARLAQWQADILIGTMLDPGRTPTDDDLAAVLDTSRRLLPDLERMLVHAWRAQLAAAGTRLLAVADMAEEISPARRTLAVGFADLVSFTRLSRSMDERALAGLVEGFESRASDIVAANGGRLVKTLGDEVLFTAADPRRAAAIALELAETTDRDGPGVRIGLAHGPVLPVMGDVFGTTVNLAARLTAIARPGTILVDEGVATAVEGAPGVEVVRMRRRPVRGLGMVQPYVLRGS